MNVQCTGTTCLRTPVTCPAKPCFTVQCVAATGECLYTAINCDDGNNCNLGQQCDVNTGACPVKTPVICPTDSCNLGACDPLTGSCSSTAVNCDDGIDCTRDSCDVNSGCQNVPDDSFCVSSNVCADSKCTGTTKGTSGCVETPKVGSCPQNIGPGGSDPVCTSEVCEDFQGCISIPKDCNNTNDKDECNTYECGEEVYQDQPKGCQVKEKDCANLGAIVGAAVGTGAAVGIAIGAAAFLAAVAVGGGVVYGATNVDNADANEVYTNPTFVAATQTSAGLSS
jgi:hypothetical protein